MRFPVSAIVPAKVVSLEDPVVRVAVPRRTLLPAAPVRELIVLALSLRSGSLPRQRSLRKLPRKLSLLPPEGYLH